MIDVTLYTFKCKRCGHEWPPRFAKEPKVCPKCKSPYWNKDYTRADKVKEKNKELGKEEMDEIESVFLKRS